MALVIPAILEETREGFLEKASSVIKLPGLKRIQVDFGDGRLIEKQLLPASEMPSLNPAFHWEAHLMVKEPKDFLEYQICGFNTLIVHFEAFPSASQLKITLADIKTKGFNTGVAINPDTSVNVLKDISADLYLIMSVVPGKQGQVFIETTPQKIADLKALLPHAIIEVDGGINETNIKTVADAGADLICVGSALVKAEDMHSAYNHLTGKIF